MSLGHSNVTHYKNPGIKTASVEEFMRAAKAAGTVEVIECAKEYQGEGEPEKKVRASTGGGSLFGEEKTDGPANPVWKAGQFWTDTSI